MKRTILALSLATAAGSVLAADVGVSVSVGQPGFYGRIDIGHVPQPRVVYVEPVIVHAPRIGVPAPRPVYLHVPPGHAKNWSKHCARYDACGVPVYFVDQRWYEEVYLPRHRDRHGHGLRGAGFDRHPGKANGKGRRDG